MTPYRSSEPGKLERWVAAMDSLNDFDAKRSIELAEEAREKEWKHQSFVAELFSGAFRWDLLHPFPQQSEEDKLIGDDFIEKVRRVLMEFIDPNEVDRTGEIPEEAILALAEIGCFGMKIPKEYGGLGFSQTNYNRVITFISSYCNSTAIWLSAHQSIGTPRPLLDFGTPEQKQKYLPRLAKGAVSGFALTEPDVGSDPARIGTTATLSEDGQWYLLNGEKLWCTNGPSAEILVVMALTSPPAPQDKGKPEVTAFIVETDTPGFEVVHRCEFMGIRGISNGLLRFRDVKVPKENMLGRPGEGLKIALTTLNTGRLTMPAMGAALGKLAVHFSRGWCAKRVQWGKPIGNHQAVAEKLADIAADTFAIESIEMFTAALVDRGGADIRLEAAVAKYFATERAWRIADDLVQIRGGRGYETAESLVRRGEDPIPAERMLRDARIARIIEGTSEIMRLFIAREALDFHVRRVKPLMDRIGDVSLKELPSALWVLWKTDRQTLLPLLGFYLRWYLKQWSPVDSVFEAPHLNVQNRDHLAFVARTSRKLARTLFHLVSKYQQRIEKEQILLRSIVDIGTDLFVMAAVLARADYLLSEQTDNSAAVQQLAHYCCVRARQRIAQNFKLLKRHHGKGANQVAAALLEGGYEWLLQDVYTDFPPQFLSAQQVKESVRLQPDLSVKGTEKVAPYEEVGAERVVSSAKEPDLISREELPTAEANKEEAAFQNEKEHVTDLGPEGDKTEP
ncbi:MAG TPA: acyl-CoA dehydrogenase family protein [Candidatus Hydrogenedentes bacterium]|nr:acyl-CoA dehydrogenase family protein [Candidatus Hydrogenedentota bacterium]